MNILGVAWSTSSTNLAASSPIDFAQPEEPLAMSWDQCQNGYFDEAVHTCRTLSSAQCTLGLGGDKPAHRLGLDRLRRHAGPMVSP